MKPSGSYAECTRCVMDTSDPEIIFDDEGRCNHCREYLERLDRRETENGAQERQLAMLIERIQRDGRGRPYDCVVGVSGGADSTYSTLIACSLGLRVLAVHIDNGWDTATAVKNIRRSVDRLDIDYEAVVLDWDEFRDLQLAFFKASVPEIETPTDVAIPGGLHQVAAAHDVKYIIGGGNPWTEGILPKSWHYDAKDATYLRAIHREFGTRKLRTLPTFDWRQESYYKFVRGIRIVYPLELVSYTSESAARTLRDELGWEPPGGKHHESTITRFVQAYVLPTKFGIDYRRATFSTRICAGELSREEALRALEKPPFDREQNEIDKRYVAKKFRVAPAELDAILARPPKSHYEYSNDQEFLERLYATYRMMFSRWGGPVERA